jgi:hypothetical protein
MTEYLKPLANDIEIPQETFFITSQSKDHEVLIGLPTQQVEKYSSCYLVPLNNCAIGAFDFERNQAIHFLSFLDVYLNATLPNTSHVIPSSSLFLKWGVFYDKFPNSLEYPYNVKFKTQEDINYAILKNQQENSKLLEEIFKYQRSSREQREYEELKNIPQTQSMATELIDKLLVFRNLNNADRYIIIENHIIPMGYGSRIYGADFPLYENTMFTRDYTMQSWNSGPIHYTFKKRIDLNPLITYYDTSVKSAQTKNIENGALWFFCQINTMSEQDSIDQFTRGYLNSLYITYNFRLSFTKSERRSSSISQEKPLNLFKTMALQSLDHMMVEREGEQKGTNRGENYLNSMMRDKELLNITSELYQIFNSTLKSNANYSIETLLANGLFLLPSSFSSNIMSRHYYRFGKLFKAIDSTHVLSPLDNSLETSYSNSNVVLLNNIERGIYSSARLSNRVYNLEIQYRFTLSFTDLELMNRTFRNIRNREAMIAEPVTLIFAIIYDRTPSYGSDYLLNNDTQQLDLVSEMKLPTASSLFNGVNAYGKFLQDGISFNTIFNGGSERFKVITQNHFLLDAMDFQRSNFYNKGAYYFEDTIKLIPESAGFSSSLTKGVLTHENTIGSTNSSNNNNNNSNHKEEAGFSLIDKTLNDIQKSLSSSSSSKTHQVLISQFRNKLPSYTYSNPFELIEQGAFYAVLYSPQVSMNQTTDEFKQQLFYKSFLRGSLATRIIYFDPS